MNCEIDNLDREILKRLQADSRTPFLEIARDLDVAGGTIHARVNRMRDAGIIQGSKIVLDYSQLGFTVSAFIGLKLVKARDVKEIQDQLRNIPEIVEIHYTTGTYSLLIKVMVTTMRELHDLLFAKLQAFEAIQSTETFVILDTTLARDLQL